MLFPREIDTKSSLKRHSSRKVGSFDSHRYRVSIDWKHLLDRDFNRIIYDPTFIHEISHHILQSTTPYGLFLSELDRFQFNCMKSFCLSFLAMYPSSMILVPIKDWIAELYSNRRIYSKMEGLKKAYIDKWIHAEFLRQILEGNLISTQLEAVESYEIITGTRLIDTKDKGSAPLINENTILGASIINESYATLNEIVALGSFHTLDKLEHGQEIDLRTNKYDELIDFFREKTVFMSPKREYVTFQILSELSFLAHYYPLVMTKPNENEHWENIHPGWRFLKLLENFDNIQILSIADIKTDASRFYNDLLSSLTTSNHDFVVRTSISLPVSSVDFISTVYRESFRLRESNRTLFSLPFLNEDNWTALLSDFIVKYAPLIEIGGKLINFENNRESIKSYYFSTIPIFLSRILMLDKFALHTIGGEDATTEELGFFEKIFDGTFGFSYQRLRSLNK